jgi:hypothetical protein
MVLLFLSVEERIAIACFNWNTGQTGYGVTLCHAVSPIASHLNPQQLTRRPQDTTRLVQCSVFSTYPDTLTLYHQHNTFAYTSVFSLPCIYNNNNLEPIKPVRDHVWNFVDNQPRRSLLHFQTLHSLIQPMDPSGEKRHSVVTICLDGLNEDEGQALVHISYHPITLSSAPPAHIRRLWLPPCIIARYQITTTTRSCLTPLLGTRRGFNATRMAKWRPAHSKLPVGQRRRTWPTL